MHLSVLVILAFLSACGQQTSRKKITIEGEGSKVVLVAGVSDSNSLRLRAKELGVKVSGDVIMRLEGETRFLNQLEINNEAITTVDVPMTRSEELPFSIESGALYLAKKDFGILEFWKTRPHADGRGVIVGVFDDGISPHQSGFKVTTTGERKLLKRSSNSTFTTFKLKKNDSLWVGEVLEDRPAFSGMPDLNGDGLFTKFKAQVSDKVCLDLNIDDSFSEDECKGVFSLTGEYFILPKTNLSIMAEFDEAEGLLRLSQPELAGDSHGEGVASVMASFNQGGIPGMDGVAPGAQIVDYDISEYTNLASESQYTMGNILLGLEWLARNGAEVANISYSLFFTSVESQSFMAKAIDELVKKYNIVLSFSAGNNGPGLGSLNRKVIYPDSVLVAGAFVSKELDERVWGVTGLPEEGRVVYYSSRGPGPLGDHGPTLISPLSSLTHSSPSEGYRAFNGTSSASPALAGAAAVLISALKQDGIKVNAPTVVQALRLSGKRLKAEPFLAQGYGIPQIESALAIYKNLMSGKQFMNIQIGANKGAKDRVGGRGVLLLTSQSQDIETIRVDLKGVISPIAPHEAQTELLTPVKLEYSKGISGSKELWVSASTSRVHINVDLAQVLLDTQGEGFGEIKIRDSKTNDLLAIIAVTVLDDRSVLQRRRSRLLVGSQGSARLHVNVPAGVNTFRVRARLLEGESSGLIISTFDSNYVRLLQTAFTDELWVPVNRAGHHQVALSMNGGTGREAVVEFEIEAMNVELQTFTTSASRPEVSIRHFGASSLYAKVELLPVAQTISRTISEVGGEVKALEAKIKLKGKMSLEVELHSVSKADISYSYSNCTGKSVDNEGKETFFGKSFTSTDDNEKILSFRCIPFDHGISGAHSHAWEMRILRVQNTVETKDMAIGMRSSADVKFSKQLPGSYEVWIKSLLGGHRVKLGVVDLL